MPRRSHTPLHLPARFPLVLAERMALCRTAPLRTTGRTSDSTEHRSSKRAGAPRGGRVLGFWLAAWWGVLAGLTLANPPNEIVVHRNLRYRPGENRAWQLDLAKPAAKAPAGRPTVVIIHGGGWVEGSRSSFSSPASSQPGHIEAFARAGFVAATIDYRLSKEALWPAALEDCRAAVDWLRENAREYDIDPDQIGAWGNSAGGHLALLLAQWDGPLVAVDTQAENQPRWPRIQAAVSDSGPVDLVEQHRHGTLRGVVELFLGGPLTDDRRPAYLAASPSAHITRDTPPLLLIYGTADEQVPVASADDFVRRLGQAGAPDVTYLRLAKVGHCPHSIQRIDWLPGVVERFFERALASPGL